MRKLLFLFFCLGSLLNSPAQNCTNWLNLPSYPSYVAIGDLDIPGNQITLEAEINLTQPYGGGPYLGSDIVGKYADPTDVNYLLRAQNAQITTTNGFFQTPDVCQLVTNKTYHVAMVYDGSSLKFYRNGFLMSQVAATGNLHQNNWITQIGFYQFAFYNVNFIGYINEVRIWNVARTQAQIQTYMNISLPSPTTQVGLLAYYTFNNLLNQQGNPSWDGSLGGSAIINQTNPTCVGFIADNYCCPSLTGTLTGNTSCDGSLATLTFHSTSISTSPYKIIYQDGNTNNFEVDNVQDGVPFPLVAPIINTTTYSLVSIQDASGCAPTLITGQSATVVINNCGSCSSWLGLPGRPSYYEVGDLNVTGNQITVEAEINRTAPYIHGTLSEGDVVSKHDNVTDVNYLLRPNHAYITTTNGYFGTPDVCDISLNKTYHVAMVYDGVALKFYRNGFLMSQIAATGNLVQNSWKTRIGYYFNMAFNENFIGYINEVRIWNVARTQAQIQAYMNTSLPTPATQPGLLAYYIFNSLINQQGNPAWNGFVGGFAAISQTNTNCIFTADNECCLPIQGTFTGNSICPGQNGQLNFHLTSAPANPPYTLSYSDQTNTYSQANVQDNIQFPVNINPAVSTQYPLLKIMDAGNCSTDITGESATITVFPSGHFAITPDTAICVNSAVQLNVSGGQSYMWTPTALLNDPAISNPVAKPTATTQFYVTGKDLNNCIVLDSVKVNVLLPPVFKTPPDQSVCKGMSVVLDGYNGSKNLYIWSPATFLNDPNSSAPVATPDQNIVYHVTISDPVCVQYDSTYDVQVLVNPSPVIIAQKSNDIDCSNLSAKLSASGASTYQWLPVAGLNDPNIATPVATLSSTTHFIVQGTSANGCFAYDSVTVIVTQTGQNAFSVPNAFTPNNDGVNDCFGVHNWGKVTLQDFSIYNRWGQRIFETKNSSECWDGTFHGQKQAAGNFIYIIKATSFCGDIVKKGTLILIR